MNVLTTLPRNALRPPGIPPASSPADAPAERTTLTDSSFRALALVFLLAMLSSCATDSTSSTLAAPASARGSDTPTDPFAPPSEYWVLVGKDPVTFYPRGFPKDNETDINHGEWVEAGPQKARFFIPRGGVEERSEHQLMTEAFSIRTASEKKEIERETRAKMNRNQDDGLSAADRIGLGLVHMHLHSRQFQQQGDQAWLNSH